MGRMSGAKRAAHWPEAVGACAGKEMPGCLRRLLILSLVVSGGTAGGEPAAAAGSDICTAGTGACEGQDGESAARIRAFHHWLDANQVSGNWQVARGA